MGYTIVIPTYHNFDSLAVLTANIATATKKHKPQSIIIVNDGMDEQTKYASEILASELLPPISVINIPHSGPLVAMQTGFDAVQTEYAILLHDDTRLVNHIPINGYEFYGQRGGTLYNFKIKIIEDPLSFLFHCIKVPESVSVGIASCFALHIQSPCFIQGGWRTLGRNQLPFTPCKNSKFDSLWLYSQYVERERWLKVHSIDSHAFIIKKEVTSQVRFNTQYPYLFGFDDFCTRIRQAGYSIYFTLETVVYHPKSSPPIDGKLSKPNPEMVKLAIERFTQDWGNSNLWTLSAIEEYRSIQAINRDTVDTTYLPQV